MIRQASLLLLTLAAGAGAALFTISYDVSALEDRLTDLNRRIVADQEALHVLRAEWSFLNQPARLEELSQRYLDLQPLAGAQIGDVAMLPVRLPAPEAPAPEVPAGGDATATLAELAEPLAGPRPLHKPLPPARPATHTASTPGETFRDAETVRPEGGVYPVAARTLDDVLADLTREGPVR